MLSSHSSESGPGPRCFLRSSRPRHRLHIPVVGSLTLLVSTDGAMVLSDQTRQGYYLSLFSVASNDATDWANYKRKQVWFGSWFWPKLRAASGDDLLPGRVPRWQKASHGNRQGAYTTSSQLSFCNRSTPKITRSSTNHM